MKFTYYLLFLVLLAGSSVAQTRKTGPFVRIDDRAVLSEQFLRWFFPQLAGRDARVYFESGSSVSDFNDPSQYAKPQGEVQFSVVDWCIPPQDPGAPRVSPNGRVGLPCTEYDKHYKPPLRGAITFLTRNGHVVPYEGRFQGELVEGPGPCYGGNPVNREDFIKRQLDRLSIFLGKEAKVVKVEGDGDDTPGTVWIKAGPSSYRHSLYAFYLNGCGYVTRFALRD
jgi:hypothetical protein